jgi:hypothetical protein
LIFEAAYEEALHFIDMHIIRALKRDEKQLYGQRRINPKIQELERRKVRSSL